MPSTSSCLLLARYHCSSFLIWHPSSFPDLIWFSLWQRGKTMGCCGFASSMFTFPKRSIVRVVDTGLHLGNANVMQICLQPPSIQGKREAMGKILLPKFHIIHVGRQDLETIIITATLSYQINITKTNTTTNLMEKDRNIFLQNTFVLPLAKTVYRPFWPFRPFGLLQALLLQHCSTKLLTIQPHVHV